MGAGLKFIDESDLFFTRFGRPNFYDTVVNETSVIDTYVDVRLNGESTETEQGKDDDLVSANFNGLSVKDGKPASLGAVVLSSSGDVWIMGSRDEDRYFVGVPIDLEKTHRLGLRIDFAARMT